MDGYLHQTLSFMKNAIKQDDDFVILVDGMERSGKSVLALQMAYFLDPTFCVDDIVYSVDEWQNKIINAEKYKCIVWDEAFRGLSKRQAISKVNKKVVETLMEIGQNNLFIIIVLPTFFELDKYAALHRCKCLLHVHRDIKYKRGFFKFYEYTKMKEMYFEGRFKYSYCRKCDFFGQYPHHYTIPQEDYRNKKANELQKLRESPPEDTITRQTQERNMLIKFVNAKFYNNVAKFHRELMEAYPEFAISLRHAQSIVKNEPRTG